MYPGMSAPAAIDADRVDALNRLIREKTGRPDIAMKPDAARRKNLWLQIPAVDSPPRKNRAPGPRASAGQKRAAGDTPADLARRFRQPLTLLLSAALLLTTAA